ncbi:penicillin-binding transpeptidase domain-containing protein [Streptomyces albidus (ex Kaewkla and Franco 2022)]|uniref:penicillin-binding transpeptidase domain-containing protein n=1 Tax=Streptomyces albidus (ex Kaewkla and Franco 2022) TaxID=722709 RepID=UPI0015EF0CEE|nr:penicillin-binding transpeptidase domain-containing protein [Streptomyces albidus (ex Kaewkla and Franco 2022)]
MRDTQKMALIGGAAAVVVGATGFGVYALVGGDSKEGDKGGVASSDGKGDKKVETGPPSEAEVRTTAQRFLTAWSSGDAKSAAKLTDDKTQAAAGLKSYHDDARVSKVALSPSSPSGAKVPFDVNAQIGYQTQRAAWAYSSSLEVVRNKKTGDAVVDWKPSVLNPKLKDGQKVKTGKAGTPPIKAVDRNGAALTKEEHPMLASILDDLRKRYGDKTDGTPGIETRIVDAKGKDTGTTLRTLSKGTPGTLKTTLDKDMQVVTEQSVKGKPKAAAVAIQPSTGEVRAVANSPADGFNNAFRGSLAPGSTMKVITSALLLDKGLASPGKQHPCPKYHTYGGWKFQNDDKFEIKDGTFAQSFARSCNTAFISQAEKLEDGDLSKEAREVFGIGQNWQVGTGTFDGSVPVQSDAQMASSLIGQGGVRMNPLNMASVAATVQSGTFKQPLIVSPSLDDRTISKASREMKPQTKSDLKSLMQLTAASGTAAKPMAGLSGDVGAKTGSAEVDGQKKPNAWFTAYNGDIAAAAVVPASGHGSDNAGPVVRKILDAAAG